MSGLSRKRARIVVLDEYGVSTIRMGTWTLTHFRHRLRVLLAYSFRGVPELCEILVPKSLYQNHTTPLASMLDEARNGSNE